MKKILLGLVAAFALTTLAAPAYAEDAPAADKAAGEAKPAKKKGKKAAKKAEGEKAPEAAPPK